jgi:endonuclease-3
MSKKERYKAFVAYFSEHQPTPTTELHYSSAFELLMAVVLSAQCTDKRVNKITPALFVSFPSPYHLAECSVEDVFPYIRSVSYPNSKSKYLVGIARGLVDFFDGKVPVGVADLLRLPGVGRKTAHVIVSVLYGQPAMAVDTHVFRVSKRLGLVSVIATTPLAVERELVMRLPKKYLSRAHHWLILHGRYICTARKPKCSVCPLTRFCRYFLTQKNN